IGRQELEQSICTSFGGAALLFWQLFVPCTDGVRSVTVGPGVKMTVNWHAPHQINGSPIVGGHTVYSVDYQGGILYALNITSGAIRTQVAVGTTSRFATPTLSQGFVLVGTLTGVTAIAKS